MSKLWREMPFFESGDTEVLKAARNKLFARNEKQIDNYTLIPSLIHVSCVYQPSWRFPKNIFRYGCCSLLIFVAKKATKGTELQLLYTPGTLQGGKVEDRRIMFTGHSHLPQWYNYVYSGNTLHIIITDYMMSLITVHILYALPICLQQ